MAGGHLWLEPQQQVPISSNIKFERLVLMCPATGFFQAPNALNQITTPFQLWMGHKDQITPSAQVKLLSNILKNKIPIDERIEAEANHFSFMNILPPNISDSHPDRDQFLSYLSTQIQQYLLQKTP